MNRRDRRTARAKGTPAAPPAGVAAALRDGMRHHQHGRLADAEACYRRALGLAGDNPDALNLLGVVHNQRGRSGEAEDLIRRAIAISPKVALYHNNMGATLRALGRDEEAGGHYQQAVKLDPGYVDGHVNLGNTLVTAGRGAEAAASYGRALALAPDNAEARIGLGAALRDAFRSDEAEAHLRRALELAPDDTRARHILALVLKDLGRFEEAERLLNEVLSADPAHVEALTDLANLHKDQDRVDAAIAAFGRALEIDPGYDVARANRGLLRLAHGRFEDGWRDYMARASVMPRRGEIDRDVVADDLDGKRVLLVMDQGLGDEIFFLRFAAELHRRGATITYLADPRIADMVGRLPFIDRCVGDGADAGAVDLTYSIGDLPGLLGHRAADDIPPPITLAPLAEVDARVAAALAALGPAPRIGVTWRAGVRTRNRLSKIAPTDGIAQALKAVPATLVALQRGPEPGELAAFADAVGREVHDMTALNDDLEAMLALVGQLDDYVCVSNTNVHLRAARGRACRVLVPHPPDYRWMTQGPETPWFPGTVVYRQGIDLDWGPALGRLARDLRADAG